MVAVIAAPITGLLAPTRIDSGRRDETKERLLVN
jgi:hypothetical protein